MGGNGRCFELIGHEPGMNPSGKDAILKERKTTPKSSKNVRLWDLVGKKLENEGFGVSAFGYICSGDPDAGAFCAGNPVS